MTESVRANWPFDDPESVAVFTTTDVIRAREPVVFVTHDDDDGAWQFFSASGASVERAMLVCLHEVFDLDSSIGEIADLPCGWQASRAGADSPWVRERKPPPEAWE